jgi:hypothetical protein
MIGVTRVYAQITATDTTINLFVRYYIYYYICVLKLGVTLLNAQITATKHALAVWISSLALSLSLAFARALSLSHSIASLVPLPHSLFFVRLIFLETLRCRRCGMMGHFLPRVCL